MRHSYIWGKNSDNWAPLLEDQAGLVKILVLCSCLMPACVPVSACLDFSLNKVFSHRFQWPCKVIHIPSPRCVCVRDSVFTCSLLWYNQFRCQCILIVLLLSPLMIWHFDSFPHSRVWLQNAPSPQFFLLGTTSCFIQRNFWSICFYTRGIRVERSCLKPRQAFAPQDHDRDRRGKSTVIWNVNKNANGGRPVPFLPRRRRRSLEQREWSSHNLGTPNAGKVSSLIFKPLPERREKNKRRERRRGNWSFGGKVCWVHVGRVLWDRKSTRLNSSHL